MFAFAPGPVSALPAPPPLAFRLAAAFPGWRPRRRPCRLLAVGPKGIAPPRAVADLGRGQGGPPPHGLRRVAVALCCLAALLGVPAPGGGRAAGMEPVDVAVRQRDFCLTVAPLNEAARLAGAADLYMDATGQGQWSRVGPCQPYFRGGQPVYEGSVRVPGDGVYLFTSTAGLREDGTLSAPVPGSPAQARVLVKTRAPLVRFTTPPGRSCRMGDAVPLEWRTEDDHVAEFSGELSVSADGGRTWEGAQTGLPASGQWAWEQPPAPGLYCFRMTVRDVAGNSGQDIVDVTLLEDEPPPPEPEPERPDPPPAAVRAPRPPPEPEPAPARLAWVEYLRAVGCVRQGRVTDGLRHYWLAVEADRDFPEAWQDMALAYKELGRFPAAREALAEAEALVAGKPEHRHLRGEISHAEGMLRLSAAQTEGDRLAARRLIDEAVGHYAAALRLAREQWKLPRMAPTYYRLGEICYHVNHDPAGARLYWRRILDLATPEPEPDVFMPPDRHDGPLGQDEAELARHERELAFRYTALKDRLDAWQRLARGMVAQLDRMERAGRLGVGPKPPVDGDRAAADAPGVYELLPDALPGISDAAWPGDTTLPLRGLSGSASPSLAGPPPNAWASPAPRTLAETSSDISFSGWQRAAPTGTWRAATGQPPEPAVAGRWWDTDAAPAPRQAAPPGGVWPAPRLAAAAAGPAPAYRGAPPAQADTPAAPWRTAVYGSQPIR